MVCNSLWIWSLTANTVKNNNNNYNNVQRPRSRFGRFMVFKKIDYLQWISAIAIFIFFMFLFQLFLPLSMVEKFDGDFLKGREEGDDSDVGLKNLVKEIGGLDFGEDLKFMPTKFLMKFPREKGVGNNVSFDNGSRTVMRFGNRKPQLALLRDRSDQSRGTWMMQEQHALKKRKGKMSVKWFGYNTLKAMDEDLAEEADSEAAGRRWLWPATGEVFWPGLLVLKTTNVRSAFSSLMYMLLGNPNWMSHILFFSTLIATVATITAGQRKCLRAASVFTVLCYLFLAVARHEQSFVLMAISVGLGAMTIFLCLYALVVEGDNRNMDTQEVPHIQLPQPTVDDQPTPQQAHPTIQQAQPTMEIEQKHPSVEDQPRGEGLSSLFQVLNFVPRVLNFVPRVLNFVTRVLNFVLQLLNFSRNSGNSGDHTDPASGDHTNPASGDHTDPASGDAGR